MKDTIDGINVMEIARDIWAKSGDLDESSAMLLKAAKADPELYVALMGPWELRAARTAIRVTFGQSRRAIIHDLKHPSTFERPTGPDNRVHALARATMTSLMDFPLPGGMPLSAATKDDLLAGAHFYLERSADMGTKGRWLERIAKALPNGQTVAQKFTEAQVKKIWEEAE